MNYQEDYYAPWNCEYRAAAKAEREEALHLHYEATREERLIDQKKAIEEENELQLKLELNIKTP